MGKQSQRQHRKRRSPFRVTGKAPQIWHPETGKVEKASYTIANGITKVRLPLQPNDAVFVVFRTNTTNTSFTLPATTEKELTTLDGIGM